MRFYAQILILYIILLSSKVIFSSVLAGTLIKTTHGLVSVEDISYGDEFIAYSYDKNITTCQVKEVGIIVTDLIIEITTDKGIIKAVSDQIFYDPLMNQWVAAEKITTDNYLLDAQLQYLRCIAIKHIPVPLTYVYHISTTAPHTFFVTEQEVLTHNFVPIIIGASWLFGLGSIEFAGFNIAAIIAGTALGIKLFKSKHKDKKLKIVATPYINSSSGGCPDPNNNDDDKDPNKKKRKFNIVSKSEFFRKVQNDYEYWKNGIYRKKHRAKGIENVEYLEWDYLHGDAEAYHAGKQHMGSIDPEALKIYKNAIPGRKLTKI